jgi:hypothetical protein
MAPRPKKAARLPAAQPAPSAPPAPPIDLTLEPVVSDATWLAPLSRNTVVGIINRWSNAAAMGSQIGALGERLLIARQQDTVAYLIEMHTRVREQRLESHEAPDAPNARPAGLPVAAWPFHTGPAGTFEEGHREFLIEGSEQTVTCPFCGGAPSGCARCGQVGRIRRWQTGIVDDSVVTHTACIQPPGLPREVIERSAGVLVDRQSARLLTDELLGGPTPPGTPGIREYVARANALDIPRLRETVRTIRDGQPTEAEGRIILQQDYTARAVPITAVHGYLLSPVEVAAPDRYRRQRPRPRTGVEIFIHGRDHDVWPERPPKKALAFAPTAWSVAAWALTASWAAIGVAAQHPVWLGAAGAGLVNAALISWQSGRLRRIVALPAYARAGSGWRGRLRQFWDGAVHPALIRVAWLAHGLAVLAALWVSGGGTAGDGAAVGGGVLGVAVLLGLLRRGRRRVR